MAMPKGKVHPRRLTPTERHAVERELWDAIAAFATNDELQRFLGRLFTRSEKVMLGRRVRIAKMLLRGKSYEVIKRTLRVGESTILGVDQWIEEHGEEYSRKLLRSHQDRC